MKGKSFLKLKVHLQHNFKPTNGNILENAIKAGGLNNKGSQYGWTQTRTQSVQYRLIFVVVYSGYCMVLCTYRIIKGNI